MSPPSQPASPAFSSEVAKQSLGHHRSSSEAPGPGSSTSQSASPYRAPAVQQANTAKQWQTRSR
ncbi:hypothetical protein [Streptomyces sp. PU-14G]|uniref:hypothetical protein n=1 Tax=Streptomyces sp. PU-14G TaxID=2800808 RepID=UPI0034DFE3BD